MKFAVLMALSIALVGVTVVVTAEEAVACKPPNCPGFGKCVIVEEELGEVQNPVTGGSTTVSKPALECYY